jgi:hypothetical protein
MTEIKLASYARAEVLNLNVTFGNSKAPLLEKFEEIVLPALEDEDYARSDGKNTYSFSNISINFSDAFGYFLQGIHVKDTKLEILSERNPETQELEFVKKTVETAPISTFILILGNHRLIHIPNQAGSPTAVQFGETFKRCLNHYVKKITKGISWNEKPMSEVNVTYIANMGSVEKQFDDIRKIKKVQFRVFTQNPRDTFEDVIENISNLNRDVQASQTNISINSPKDVDAVKDIFEEAGERAHFTMDAELINGEEKRITQDDFKTTYPINLQAEKTFDENILEVLAQVKLPSLLEYKEKMKEALIKFLERKRNDKK